MDDFRFVVLDMRMLEIIVKLGSFFFLFGVVFILEWEWSR